MDRYDSIIIGAGHNGLVCATYLAQSGQRVLVLEAADTPGGLAATHEFHPGFHASPAHSVGHFLDKIVKDLRLSQHGYPTTSGSLPTVGLSPEREHIVVSGGSVQGASTADAAAYRTYRELMQRFADVLEPLWQKAVPRLGNNNLRELMTFGQLGLNLRRLGKVEMGEFLRMITLPARDLLDERFGSEHLKAILSWDGLVGSKLAPRSPNGAVLAMLYRTSGRSGGPDSVPAASVGDLIRALSSAATAAGSEIQYGAAVERITIEPDAIEGRGLAATGVELANGDQVGAARVISAADPRRTFRDLVGVESLDIGFTNRIRRLRCDGFVAKLHLALNGLPEFEGLTHPAGRMIIAPDLDAIEFAYDDAKYGACSQHPVMEVVIPSLLDPSLAPAGQHTLSAHVMYAPYQLKGGWNPAARDEMCERALDTLARYAPRIREQTLHQELLTPADLEDRYRVTGGHWHHTELAFDQMFMMRPTYEAAQYRTPIPGLFLCGAGSHPGGDLVGAAGHNAAQEILR